MQTIRPTDSTDTVSNPFSLSINPTYQREGIEPEDRKKKKKKKPLAPCKYFSQFALTAILLACALIK